MFKIAPTNPKRKILTDFKDETVSFTDDHFYTIDTVGLYHYQQFLTPDEVSHANTVIDEWLKKADPSPSKFPFFDLDYLFCRIMTKRWIVEACVRTVGEWYRLDHCVGIQQPGKIQSAKTGNWVDQGYFLGNVHGGNYAAQGSVYFHSFGSMAWSGHMTFGISLIGQDPEDGGFCFIPGSHKQSTLESGSAIFKSVMGGNYKHQALSVPKLMPGDAVLFPENMMHGMTPMKKGALRRAIYYKFVPGCICWRDYEQVKHYGKMAQTDFEKRLLRGPYVAQFEDNTPNMTDNFYREPSCSMSS